MSLLLGYFTTSFAIELLVFLFLQIARILKTKSNPKSTIQVIVSGDTTIMTHSTKPASDESASSTKDQIQWLEKKYEFLFEDYKDSQKIYFSFAYYLTAFNVIYILLIFSLQTVPVVIYVQFILVSKASSWRKIEFLARVRCIAAPLRKLGVENNAE